MSIQELTKIEKKLLIKLHKDLLLHQTDRCKISVIEYELKLDKYSIIIIANKLELKGFIELVTPPLKPEKYGEITPGEITPQFIKIKNLGEEYIKEHFSELVIIDTATMKPSEILDDIPELKIYNKIFIIHGHDERNLLILEKLLKERWKLTPIILRQLPGKGRTMIEKFEEEAKDIRYAFAIYTPDDFIDVKDSEYCQARPNTIFELGWFYGNKGRHRVCILCKKGTKIHSDLDGINRIDFVNSVEEKIIDIENELQEANIIPKEPIS